MESIRLSAVFPVSSEKLYNAWLSTKEHSAFTGSEAKVSAKVNGKFTAWDGYIKGKNLELKAHKKIVQTWRTSEFEEDAPDSILELEFKKKGDKTVLYLYHHDLQKGDAKKYKQGWKDYYFTPMKAYFEKLALKEKSKKLAHA
jgi:activator of HSP90 ATPase